MSEKAKGRFFSKETRLKMSKSAKNKNPINEITRIKMRKAQSGKNNGNYGNYKKIIDTKTGIIYNSIHDVLKLYDYSIRSIRNQLSGYQKNKTSLK